MAHSEDDRALLTSVVSQLLTAWQALVQPVNLLAIVAGTVAGAALGAVIRRCGGVAAGAVVLLLPVAAFLDPVTGLMLTGAALAAVGTKSAARWLILTLFAVAAVLMLGSGWAAALVQDLTDSDKVVLLMAAAAASVILAAISTPSRWLASALLTVTGVLLQLSPLAHAADGDTYSPLPFLLGLLAAGPAVAALAAPDTATTRETPHTGRELAGRELAATLLPAFLAGIPVTLGAALLALNLSDYGLALGPRLMTQRPKIVLGLLVATLVAFALTLLGRGLGSRLVSHGQWPQWSDKVQDKIRGTLATRLGALAVIMLACAGFYWSSFDADGQISSQFRAQSVRLIFGTVLGGIAVWRGFDPAPLAVGIVLGQLLQVPLASFAVSGLYPAVLVQASRPLLAVAAATLAAAVFWPVIARVETWVLPQRPPAQPSDPSVG